MRGVQPGRAGRAWGQGTRGVQPVRVGRAWRPGMRRGGDL